MWAPSVWHPGVAWALRLPSGECASGSVGDGGGVVGMAQAAVMTVLVAVLATMAVRRVAVGAGGGGKDGIYS